MTGRHVISLVLALAIGATACGSKKASLGRIDDLQPRANALGCKLKYTGIDATCEVLVGPCNCQLWIAVSGEFTGAPDHLSGEIKTFGVGLHDCQRSQSLSPLWSILDPMFDHEGDRNRVHVLVANPPHVNGAASDATTHLVTGIGPFTADVTWAPRTWDAVKLPDPNLAESWIDIDLFPSPHRSPDELTNMVANHADWPALCRDNTRRPWAERPSHPGE